jgi:hypothetical protein
VAVGSGWTGSRLRGGWSSVCRRSLIRAYVIKGVISDTLASLVVAARAVASMDMEAVGGKQEF